MNVFGLWGVTQFLFVYDLSKHKQCRGFIVAKQFPASPGLRLAWSSPEQYNDYPVYLMIQAIIFIKTVLKYYAPLRSCRAVEYNAPTNSSDISFRDLFVRNCLSYNPNWTLPDMKKWCSIYSKSRILMLQNDTIAKDCRWELAEIWTWKQFNNGRLTVLNAPACNIRKYFRHHIIKINYEKKLF
jgi:hypothetical protein